jgi:predicted DNA-binding WGR domain protein
MMTPPPRVYLERSEPAARLSRFYGLEVAADLFGEWCLTRRWGRIGSAGRRQVRSFTSREQAEEALRQFLVAKQRRGYQPR